MANVVVWADIPVVDLDRARTFYSHLLGTHVADMEGVPDVAVLRSPDQDDPMAVSADLALNSGSKPSTTEGTVIYLSAQGDIDGMLKRTEEAGGVILQDKKLMDMVGWIAFIKDTEGNKIGIHQPADTMA